MRYTFAFLKNDTAGMKQLLTSSAGTSAINDWLLHQDSCASAYGGHLKEARATSRRAIAGTGAAKERAAIYEAAGAVREAFLGYPAQARRGAGAAIQQSNGREIEYGAGLAYALAGDAPAAQLLIDRLAQRFPEDTLVRYVYRPVLDALLLLHAHQPLKALERLEIAKPYDLALAGTWNGFFGTAYPVYVRGEALLAAGRASEAAAEFQKILHNRGLVAIDPMGPIARWKLGQAYALAGDRTRAQATYTEALHLWRDADADLPVLQQLRAEAAALAAK